MADDHYGAPLPQDAAYEGEWDGEWVSDDRYEGEWRGSYTDAGYYPERGRIDAGSRDAWLDECRARYRDSNVEGALIGGALGGLAGNRIAGRGNRTVGTIAGAAVGAIAGAAIDSAEGRRGYDECEAYLDRYMAADRYYGDSYTVTRMVPVMTYRFGRVETREEEIEEEVVETVMVEDVRYETVREPVAAVRRAAPGKRIRSRK